jgi:carbonic anhydrase
MAAAESKDGHGAAADPKSTAANNESSASQFQAFQRLMAGNTRFVAGTPEHPHQDADVRGELAKGQKTFAVVLTCADSRVAPEIVFDQGLGDLFVLRVAGNVANDDVQASIEYAVEHLGATLVVVLGHERCGAVKAAVAGGDLPGHLPGLIRQLTPAVDRTKGLPGDPLDNAVCANARMAAQQLRESAPILKARVQAGTLAVMAARYDLDTGMVEVLW